MIKIIEKVDHEQKKSLLQENINVTQKIYINK